jgi:hypothetical protein
MSVYSSTDQINLLKNIFTPEFQFGAAGYFQPTVKTYLPGNVEIGDPTTDYHLFLNGNSLATDTTIAAWSSNPAISTLSMGSNSITNVSSLLFASGNSFVGTTGTIRNLSGVQTINSFPFTVSSDVVLGTDMIYLGASAGIGGSVAVSNVVAIGLRAGTSNASRGLVAIGTDAAFSNSGNSTIAIGLSAGFKNEGNLNVFVGVNAGNGMKNVNGNNVAVGTNAGLAANNSIRSVTLGVFAGGASVKSFDCVSIGTNAGEQQNGSYIVGVGYQAARSNIGTNVVAIGYNSGASNTGSNCIFLGSNGLGSTVNSAPNTFYVYSTVNNTPFLQGDMSGNTLGIGQTPAPGFGLAVKGAIQNTLSISATAASTLTLTPNNAATRFFVSNVVTLTLPTAPPSGTYWVITNTSTAPVAATITAGATVNNVTSISLTSTISGVGRHVTIAYSGSGTNFFAF